MDVIDFCIPVTSSQIRCIDERLTTTPIAGVQIPGGVYGIIDMVKALKDISETQAWTEVVLAGIPIAAHEDEHQGILGCGYARLVEQNPDTIGIAQAVIAAHRMDQVKKNGGTVATYLGNHRPTHAVLNTKLNTTIDSKNAWENNLGIFNCDIWAINEYAAKLGLNIQAAWDFIKNLYQKTIEALSPIRDLIIL